MSLLKRYWWHILIWLAILVLAAQVLPGADPYLPLLIAVAVIAVLEASLRLITRRPSRR